MPLRLPGDHVLKRLVISNDFTEIDISSIMYGLEIYEDLYSPGFTGKLHLVDAIDLYENMPILGGETLEVNFSTDLDGNPLPKEYDFIKKFIVTGIVDIQPGGNDTSKIYTLELVSPIYFKNHEVKLSRLYNANVADIISDIYTNALGQTEDLEIEKTKYSESFLVPNWTPLRTIDYLSKHSQAGTGFDSSYLFFETKDGFTYSSLSNLFKKEPTRTLTMKNTWTNQKIIENDPHVITQLDINTTPDLLDGISAGLYGSTLHTIDLINKLKSKRTFEYDKTFSNSDVRHLNTKQLPSWPNNQKDFKHYLTSANFLSDHSKSWRLERNSRMNQINSYTLIAKCPNFTKQKVSDIVTLDIKSAKRMTEVQGKEVKDEALSGNYLIRGIRHLIAQGGYDMIMELVKDSR